MDWLGTREDHLRIVEFAYNIGYQSTIGMTPFDVYARSCRSPSCLLGNRDPMLVGLKMIKEIIKIVDLVKKSMKEA